MQWHRGAHQRSVTCQCPMPVWYNTNLCESQLSFQVSLSLKNIHLTSHFLCFSIICNSWSVKLSKSITEDKFNLIVLLYFTLFLPRSHNFLSLRTPPWHCGSLVLCWQHVRLDCLSGASSLDWPSEGWHPVGTATSKSRCVCSVCGRVRMLDWRYCDVCLFESLSDSNMYIHTCSNSNAHTSLHNLVLGCYTLKVSLSKAKECENL